MKVCFVAPYAYTLFNSSRHFPFGGLEVQAHILATGLAAHQGFDVNFVVFDHGQAESEEIAGVTVTKYRPTKFRPATNFLWPSMLGKGIATSTGRVLSLRRKWATRPIYHAIMAVQSVIDASRALRLSLGTLLEWLAYPRLWEGGLSVYYQHPNRVETYRNINADIYIGFGASELMAELAAFCNSSKKKFILFGASDSDFDDSYVPHSNIRNYYGCRGGHCYFSLVSADHIVVQNDLQEKAAREHFGQQATIILNPIDLSLQPNAERPRAERDVIFWIGKADIVKQPLLVFEIAKACPDLHFLMVVNPNRPEIEEKIATQQPGNVEILQKISRADVPAALERSILLLNTSLFEGFSNAMLEAFRAGTPVVSLTADPNNVIETWGCGRILNGDFAGMVAAVRSLVADEPTWKSASDAARAYVARHHATDVIVDQLIGVIGQVLEEAAGLRPLQA
ncbi:glycosyltransferase family 4 protein [Paramagnetospirillum kuznetsovii]|nr:glycosyltransferase family 4 protein [Paramagnetospirillum kuznetsovii]